MSLGTIRAIGEAIPYLPAKGVVLKIPIAGGWTVHLPKDIAQRPKVCDVDKKVIVIWEHHPGLDIHARSDEFLKMSIQYLPAAAESRMWSI